MHVLKRAIALLACAGFVVSLVVHAATFLAPALVVGRPGIWALHVGVFVVFGPAVLWTPRDQRRDFKLAAAGAPRWMVTLTLVAFAYALVNFAVFFALSEGAMPSRRDDGTYAMVSHGTVVRAITEEEFTLGRARITRGFSGHWMLFYAAAATLLVAASPPPSAQRM